MRILVTGGAGFVGSVLVRAFKKHWPSAEVVAFDNLHRRGSELNINLFREEDIRFVHGDIRNAQDLDYLNGNFDVMIDACAEPSVHVGADLNSTDSIDYAVKTNLVGTFHSLEFARKRVKQFYFLSTSRVYSLKPLKAIPLKTERTRYSVSDEISTPGLSAGLSARGISESFPVHLPRSLYGATKLASEFLVQEYMDAYGLKGVINRCGVIAGPGQFGKVDQGVFTLWMAHHYFKLPLCYTGFQGEGKQVRDLLHPADLFKLLLMQIESEKGIGETVNVGGGLQNSVSMLELTELCQKLSGNQVAISKVLETGKNDIPYYVSDTSKVQHIFGWKQQYSVEKIMTDIHEWLHQNQSELKKLFCSQ